MDIPNDDLTRSLEIIQENLRKVTEDHSKKLWLHKGKLLLIEKIRGNNSVDSLCCELVDFLMVYFNVHSCRLYTCQSSYSTLHIANGMFALHEDAEATDNQMQVTTNEIECSLLGDYPTPMKLNTNISLEDNAVPHYIATIPAIYEQEVIGIIQLIRSGEFSLQACQLLSEFQEPIGAAIYTALEKRKLEKVVEELSEKDRELNNRINAINRSNATIEFDLDGNILMVNDTFCKLMGYEAAELINKNHSMLVDEKSFNSEEYKRFWAGLRAGEFQRGQFKRITKAGTYVWIYGNYNPILDAQGKVYKVLKITTDITVAKEQQLELKQQIDALNNSAIVSEANADGVITFVNEMFCQISEFSKEELIGQNHRVLKSGKQPDGLFTGMWKAISMGKIWQGEVVNKKKGGGYYWVDTTIVPFKNEEGKIYKYVSIRFDITKKKELELELEYKLKERTEMLQQLSAQNKQLEDFNHIISHNLRGPLSNLLLLNNMIDTTNEVEKKLIYIEKIKVVTNSLKDTFEELVEATQIRMDTEIETEVIYFKDSIAKATNALEGEIFNSGAVISVNITEVAKVKYPKKYLDSIIYNLVGNAIKYRSPQRVPEIAIRTFLKGDWIYMEVQDNGIGIDLQAHGGSLFKLRKTFHEHPEARGFGLFITKTQIDSLGGHIEAKSTLGAGTMFLIKLCKI